MGIFITYLLAYTRIKCLDYEYFYPINNNDGREEFPTVRVFPWLFAFCMYYAVPLLKLR